MKRLKQGRNNKYIPVYRKIDLNGNIYFDNEENKSQESGNDLGISPKKKAAIKLKRVSSRGEGSLGNKKKNLSKAKYTRFNLDMVNLVAVKGGEEKDDIQNVEDVEELNREVGENIEDESKKEDEEENEEDEEENDELVCLMDKTKSQKNKNKKVLANLIEKQKKEALPRKSVLSRGEKASKELTKKIKENQLQHQTNSSSVSTSSGCNISTPSWENGETKENEKTKDETERNIDTPKTKKIDYILELTSASSSETSGRCEETMELSGGESTSVEDLVAYAYENNLKIFLEEYKNSELKKNINEGSYVEKDSQDESIDVSFTDNLEEGLNDLSEEQQLKLQQEREYLLNLEATEVEVEFIVYPDDCCPVCFSEKFMCCCKKGFKRLMGWMEATKAGKAFWTSRKCCYRMVEHKWFETFIIGMIIFSSLMLVCKFLLHFCCTTFS